MSRAPSSPGPLPSARSLLSLSAPRLQVAGNTLQAVYIQNEEQQLRGLWVEAWPGKSCHEMTLSDPVDFYIAGNTPGLFPLKPNQELWIEVTVPPKGPPRPTQLALKEDGSWKPLAYR